MIDPAKTNTPNEIRTLLTRRKFLKAAAAGGATLAAGGALYRASGVLWPRASTFVASAPSYSADLTSVILAGMAELGVTERAVRGKTILLKPNLVESHAGSVHINTHPSVLRAAAEAFRKLGASRVLVAEGPGHRRDTLHVLEESGTAEALIEDHIPFIDLNYEEVIRRPNLGGVGSMRTLILPQAIEEADWIVSMPKMKTHHWVGVTLAMKNLFGLMPGSFYGWPKNLLHQNGIAESILDINATVRPDFAIVDGIIGMEGDGPIMGTPREMGILVMGANFPAVDATCARLMGIDPARIPYLAGANGWLGPIAETSIEQRGEHIAGLRRDFELMPHIPAQQGIRLS